MSQESCSVYGAYSQLLFAFVTLTCLILELVGAARFSQQPGSRESADPEGLTWLLLQKSEVTLA